MRKFLAVAALLLASIVPSFGRTYTTNFPNTENPISENGNWVNGGTLGGNWGNVYTTPGFARGTVVLANYADATALLQTGSWGADQSVTETIKVNSTPARSCFPETEARLRSNLSSGISTGYEVTFAIGATSDAYVLIARWNGARGNFTILTQLTGAQYGVVNGDTTTATIQGSTIKAYKNGVLMATVTDTTFTSGNPGMGFNTEQETGACAGTDTAYGISSYTGTDNVGAVVRNVKTTCGAKGDGSTNDLAAINTCIGQLASGDTLEFPAGTYHVSATPTPVTASGITIDGSSSTAIIQGSFTGPIFQVGNGGLTASTPLLADAAVGATTFTTNVAALGGVSAGNYILLQQGGVDSSTGSTATQCDISGCRGEVVKVASVSGNTVTVTTSLHVPYNVATNAANASKLTGTTTGLTMQNIIIDGSSTASTGLAVNGLVESTITGVTARNVVDAAMVGNYGFNDIYNNITVTGAGSHAACAWNHHASGHMTWNNISLTSLNTASPTGFTFGFCANTSADDTSTGVTVNMTGASPGRAVKFTGLAYSTFNTMTVTGASGGNNGINIEFYSNHDTWNNCNLSANNSGNFVLFGNYNDFTTLNTCTMSVGSNGSLVNVEEAASGQGRRDTNLVINGGTYSGTSGFEQIQIFGNTATIQNTHIGPGSAGINFNTAGLTGLCINNNIFSSGMSYSYAANGGVGFANGNTLGSPVFGVALPTGTCGSSPPPGVANYYVTTTGNDANAGTQAAPWKTLQHASDAYVAGSTGTIIHAGQGAYAPPNVTRGGASSTIRTVFQCDAGVADAITAIGKCTMTNTFFVTANNVDVTGFDIGNNVNAQLGLDAVCTISGTPCTTGNSVHFIGNYVHDLGQNVTNSAGILGCPEAGAIQFGSNQHGHTATDPQALRNLVVNYGVNPAPLNCHTAQGIYVGDVPAGSIGLGQNNIVIRAPISGLTNSGSCLTVYSNNTVISTSEADIMADQDNTTCPGGVAGDNQIVNNAFFNSTNESVFNVSAQPDCTTGHPTLFSHNISDGIVTDFNPARVSCDTVTPGTTTNFGVHQAGSSFFVNYQTTSYGDLHLRVGSAGIGGGVAISGITPTTDFFGTTRTGNDVGAIAASPAPSGVNYYVATNGSDSNPGTQVSPWLTLQHANDTAVVSTTANTNINVVAGSYTADRACSSGERAVLCATKGGPSKAAARLVWNCLTPATQAMHGTTQGCYLIEPNQTTDPNAVHQFAISIEGSGANNIDVVGFHFAPNPWQAGGVVGVCNNDATPGSQCPNLNSVHLIGNLEEAMASSRAASLGNPCVDSTGDGIGAGMEINNRHAHWVDDPQYLNNIVYSFGAPTCSRGYAFYINGKNAIAYGNRMFGSALGMHIYDQGCGMRISNNDIINPWDGGILIWNTGDFDGDIQACAVTGPGLNSILNNIVVDVQQGYTSLGGGYGFGMQFRSECNASHPTLVSHNLMFGNAIGNFVGYNGAPPDSCASTVGTVTENPTTTFVSYNRSGTGNYNLAPLSQAVRGGTSGCVAGGFTPCVPTTDAVGTPMSSPLPIGALTSGTSGTVPPAPTGLTVTVH